MYYDNGCNDIPDYANDCCPDKEEGRIRHMAFMHRSFVFANDDYSDTSEWQRGVSEGKLVIIANVRGQLPEATVNEEDGFGDIDTNIASYTFEPSFVDQKFGSNCEHYNGMKNTTQWIPILVTNSYVIPFVKPATIMPKQVIPEGIRENAYWNVSMRVTQKDLPCPQLRPDDSVFSCDFQ